MAFSLRDMDDITKLMFILLISVIVYFLAIVVFKPLIIPVDATPSHTVAMGDHMMNFTNPYSSTLNAVGILLAVFVGFLISLKMRAAKKGKIDELNILKKALSQDEKKIVEEITKVGEITQDSLRFRLNWSKAKLSAIIGNLDRMNVIQRERQGKTYNIFLSKKN